MNFLANKRILIGITGGIAAYKTPSLVRHLKQAGSDVKVIVTNNAEHFVQPELFGYLTGHPPYSSSFVKDNRFTIHHIDFQQWADLLIIAPASANILAKMEQGIADDLLSTTALSVTCPILVCPAMNSQMLYNPAVQKNLDSLQKRGVHVLPPESGSLLCQQEGEGRLPSIERIVLEAEKKLAPPANFLKNKTVLITLGSSREYLDPVRFLSNASSGAMGLALAESCYVMGADKIILLKGEAVPSPVFPADIITCQDTGGFYQAYRAHYKDADVAFFSAALADFTPVKKAAHKIKKGSQKHLQVEFQQTEDIASWAGKNRRKGQILIGFAAEDKNPLQNSRKKLEKKSLDALILNVITPENPAFSSCFNEVHILFPDGKSHFLEKQAKKFLARKIMLELEGYFQADSHLSAGGK